MAGLNGAVYELSTRVRYSEVGHGGRMTLPALINMFQDCSIFHSEAVGFGPERLKEAHRGWVLTRWQIVVDRYPLMSEELTVGTFASHFKTVSATRNFYLKDADGTVIARANSTWAFMDLAAMRPVRPAPEHVAAYSFRDPLDMPSEERHVAVPESLAPCEPVTVRPHHIDTNEHVNNCQYVQMALDVLPRDSEFRQVRVDFKRSAVLGDVIWPKLAREDGRTVVELADAGGGVYGVVELA